MEAQFSRVAKSFWQIDAEMELTDEWTNRLTGMAAALSKYRKSAYTYIWEARRKGVWVGDETTYPVPASVYAKQTEV